MAEFKTGDKVRITSTAEALENIFAPPATNGLEGVVTEVYPGGFGVVFAEEIDGSDIWFFNNDMAEVI